MLGAVAAKATTASKDIPTIARRRHRVLALSLSESFMYLETLDQPLSFNGYVPAAPVKGFETICLTAGFADGTQAYSRRAYVHSSIGR